MGKTWRKKGREEKLRRWSVPDPQRKRNRNKSQGEVGPGNQWSAALSWGKGGNKCRQAQSRHIRRKEKLGKMQENGNRAKQNSVGCQLWSFLSSEFCEAAPIQSNNADAGEETPNPSPSNKESNYYLPYLFSFFFNFYIILFFFFLMAMLHACEILVSWTGIEPMSPASEM